MSSNYPGARPHGAPQDTEMDVAWQELMAIPELQVTLTYGFPRLCLSPPNRQMLSQYLKQHYHRHAVYFCTKNNY